MSYNRPRGTEDWLPKISETYRIVTNALFSIAHLSGYSEIATPIFENVELFVRSVGPTSDIVKKEFYNFKDKSDRELALRPEGTASVIRAVIEEKLIEKLPSPIKLSYAGPMFRYERPQSGRLRQFHQFGVECINTNSVMDDVEVLMMALSMLDTIGIKKYRLLINNIGNFSSREKWIIELRDYFKKYEDQLSDLSKSRIETNPLRILDDKEDGKKEFVKNAPKIDKFLSEKEVDDFKIIIEYLKLMKIDFVVDKTLARGLDYYTNFVFEINSTSDKDSSQTTLIGGGRYANLVKELGGKDCGCVGFALGLERILLAMQNEKLTLPQLNSVEVVVANLSEKTKDTAFIILSLLRSQGISSVCKFDAIKLTKSFNYAESLAVKYVVIVGEKEIATKKVTIKNQQTLKQEQVDIADIVSYIKKHNN